MQVEKRLLLGGGEVVVVAERGIEDWKARGVLSVVVKVAWCIDAEGEGEGASMLSA